MVWSRAWNSGKLKGRKPRIFYCPWEETCLFGTRFKPSKSREHLLQIWILTATCFTCTRCLASHHWAEQPLACWPWGAKKYVDTRGPRPWSQFSCMLQARVLDPGTLNFKTWGSETQRKGKTGGTCKGRDRRFGKAVQGWETVVKTKVTEEETWIWQFLQFFSLLALIENKKNACQEAVLE